MLAQPEPNAASLELELELLSLLIARTHFSISTDESRAALNSALFEWEGDHVRMVTTDGHRLSKMEVRAPGRQATATMLIPLKAIGELKRLEARADVTKAEQELCAERRHHANGRAFFQIGGAVLGEAGRCAIPPYSQVIPQTTEALSAFACSFRGCAPRSASLPAIHGSEAGSDERCHGITSGRNRRWFR